MKRILHIIAIALLAVSCSKGDDSKTEVITLDKVVKSAASAIEENLYLLEVSLSGGGYTVNIAVKSTELSLKNGIYEIGKDGCEASFNDGYIDRNVSGGDIEISSDGGSYDIRISAKSRNTQFDFRYRGAVEFSSFQGTVIRNCSISSAAMGQTMKYSIYLPVDYSSGESFPVLYLLHGYGDENNAWLDKGNLAEIAHRHEQNGGQQMIVVCPDGLTTFYYDSPQTKFKTYFFEELVPAIEMTYKVKKDKYSRAVAGLSMGGYGTLYYGLGNPEMFCYAYACSAAIQMTGLPSLYDLARKADPATLPGITLEMGTEDWVTGNGADFHNTLSSLGINHEYIARSGVHDWKFWQECLPKVLNRCAEAFED